MGQDWVGEKKILLWMRIPNFKASHPEDDFPLASLLPPKSSCYLHPLEKTNKSSYFREINEYLELGLAQFVVSGLYYNIYFCIPTV